MGNALKFRVQVGVEEPAYVSCLGNGKVGVVSEDYPFVFIYAVDMETGEVAWKQDGYEVFGHVSHPLYDGDTAYLAMRKPSGGSKFLAAQNTATGDEAWRCMLTNSTYQFMVPLAQSSGYVAVCNSNAGTLIIIDKTTGKAACKMKLKHGMYDYEPNLLAWGEQFITLVPLKQTYGIDLYDPTQTGGFVRTISESLDRRICRKILVGDDLFYFTDTGIFSKVNLVTGEAGFSEKIYDTEESFYFSRQITHVDGILYCGVEIDDKFYLFTYDIAGNKWEFNPLELRHDPIFHGNILPLCGSMGYLLWDEGILKYDVSNGGTCEEVTLEGFKENFGKSFVRLHADKYNESWMVAEDKLVVVNDEGELFCWEI